MLENLATIIPGIITLEVGIDISLTEMSGDIVLYSEFESKDALDNYQLHPEHKKIMPLILEARQERRIVDYVV
ncbi:MAG TPA: Dabb family protein [Lentimicrobium sp.]|nr:Dabb family protein [Lentimicrobium sp.]